jgi:hypothetical protein
MPVSEEWWNLPSTLDAVVVVELGYNPDEGIDESRDPEAIAAIEAEAMAAIGATKPIPSHVTGLGRGGDFGSAVALLLEQGLREGLQAARTAVTVIGGAMTAVQFGQFVVKVWKRFTRDNHLPTVSLGAAVHLCFADLRHREPAIDPTTVTLESAEEHGGGTMPIHDPWVTYDIVFTRASTPCSREAPAARWTYHVTTRGQILRYTREHLDGWEGNAPPLETGDG